MEFLLTAERFPRQRALELGLVNEIVPADELLDAALHDGRGASPPTRRSRCRPPRRACCAASPLPLDEAYKIEQEISSMVFQSEDAKEGPKAFAEKRKPNWQGR